MKEMPKAHKEELQKQGKKGFTLMEMLIVIAIIAVLVAIAIPVFTAQLSKARAQTDAANIRSGYASVMATVLSDNVTTATTYKLQKNAGVIVNGASGVTDDPYACEGNSSDLGTTNENIGGLPIGTGTGQISWSASDNIFYTWDGSKLTAIKTTAS